MQKAGYAHSRTWAAQVIALINKYKLYQYDERPADYEIESEPIVTAVAPIKRARKAVQSKTYIVKQGDNLSIIAKKNGTSVTALMKKNGLKSSALQPKQKLVL